MKPPAKRAFGPRLVGMPYEPEEVATPAPVAPPATLAKSTSAAPLTKREKDAKAKRDKRAKDAAAREHARELVKRPIGERIAEEKALKVVAREAKKREKEREKEEKKREKATVKESEEKERDEKAHEKAERAEHRSVWAVSGGFNSAKIDEVIAAGDRDHGDINTPWDGESGRAHKVVPEGTGQHIGGQGENDYEEHIDSGTESREHTIGESDEKTETDSPSVHVTPPLRAEKPFAVKLTGYKQGETSDAYAKRNHEIRLVMDGIMGENDYFNTDGKLDAFEVVSISPELNILRCKVCGFETDLSGLARKHFESAVEAEPLEYERVMQKARQQALKVSQVQQTLIKIMAVMPHAAPIHVAAPWFTEPKTPHADAFKVALDAYRKERKRTKAAAKKAFKAVAVLSH